MDDIRINKILPERGKLRFNKAEVKFLYFNNKKVWPKVDAVELPIKDSEGNLIKNIVFNNINDKYYNKYNGSLQLDVDGTPEIETNNNNCIRLFKTIETVDLERKVLYRIEYLDYGNATVAITPKDTTKYKKTILPVECNKFIFEHYKGDTTNNVNAKGTRNIQITIKSEYNGSLHSITKSNIKTDCDWITINDDVSGDISLNTVTFSYNVDSYESTTQLRSGNITITPDIPSNMSDVNYDVQLSYRITQSAVETETLRIMYGGAESHEVINNNHIDLYVGPKYNNVYDYQNPFNAGYTNDGQRYTQLSLYDSANSKVPAKFESSNPIVELYSGDSNITTGLSCSSSKIPSGEESTITAIPLSPSESVVYDIQPITVSMNRIDFELEQTSNTIAWNDNESKYVNVTLNINGQPVDAPEFSIQFDVDSEILDVKQHGNTIEYKFIKQNLTKQDINSTIDISYYVNNNFELTKKLSVTQNKCPYTIINSDTKFSISGPESLQYSNKGDYKLTMTGITESDLQEISWSVNNTNISQTNNKINTTITNNLPGENISEIITITCVVTDMAGNQKPVTKNVTCYSEKSKYIEFVDKSDSCKSIVITNGYTTQGNYRLYYKTTDNIEPSSISLTIPGVDVSISTKTKEWIQFGIHGHEEYAGGKRFTGWEEDLEDNLPEYNTPTAIGDTPTAIGDDFYNDKQISISADGYKQNGNNSTRTIHVDNYSLRFNDSVTPYLQSKTYAATGESTKDEDNPKLQYTYTVNGDNTKAIVITSDPDRFNVTYTNNDMIGNVSFSKLYFDVNLNDNTSNNIRKDTVIVQHNTYPQLSLKLDVTQQGVELVYATAVSIRNINSVPFPSNTLYIAKNESNFSDLLAYVEPQDYNVNYYEWDITTDDLNGNINSTVSSNKTLKVDTSKISSQKYVVYVKKSGTEKISSEKNIEIVTRLTSISINSLVYAISGKEKRVPITIVGASSNNVLSFDISNNDTIKATIDNDKKELIINNSTSSISGDIIVNCTDKLGSKVSTTVHVDIDDLQPSHPTLSGDQFLLVNDTDTHITAVLHNPATTPAGGGGSTFEPHPTDLNEIIRSHEFIICAPPSGFSGVRVYYKPENESGYYSGCTPTPKGKYKLSIIGNNFVKFT